MQTVRVVIALTIASAVLAADWTAKYSFSEDAALNIKGVFNPNFKVVIKSTSNDIVVVELNGSPPNKIELKGAEIKKAIKKKIKGSFKQSHSISVVGVGQSLKLRLDKHIIGSVPLPKNLKVNDEYDIAVDGFLNKNQN